MKENTPEIKVTDETRLILDNYLRKVQNRREQRIAKKYSKLSKPVKLGKPFQEIIDQLEVIERLLITKKSHNGEHVFVLEGDEKRVQSAAKYVETAVALLKTLKKSPSIIE